MKHASPTQFGRTLPACPPPEDAFGMLDKWEGLRLLTETAKDFGLSHRSLSVLRALLSFLPARLIRPDEAIVYPSNRTLSERMNGMPESTLRRHLGTLVQAGIVSRRDSPNRKRFARRAGQAAIAFGFDLAPLARLADTLKTRAKAAADNKEKLAVMRARLAELRAQAIDAGGDTAATETARRILRNKPDVTAIAEMIEAFEAQIVLTDPPEMSASDTQNERHIDIETKSISDSEAGGSQKSEPDFVRLTSVCKEYTSYFPEPVRSWHDLIGMADRLSPMMGIDPPVFHDAMRVMGTKSAVAVVLCMLENLSGIQNPGGYLRRLTQRAGIGAFHTESLLSALERRAIVS